MTNQEKIDFMVLDVAHETRISPLIIDYVAGLIAANNVYTDWDLLQSAFFKYARLFYQRELSRTKSRRESEQLRAEFNLSDIPVWRLDKFNDEQKELLIVYSSTHSKGKIKYYQIDAMLQAIDDIKQIKRLYSVSEAIDAFKKIEELIQPIIKLKRSERQSTH